MLNIALIALTALLWLLQIALDSRETPSPLASATIHGVALVVTALTVTRLVEAGLFRMLVQSARRRATSDLLHVMISIALYLVATLLLLRFGFEEDPINLLATSTVLSVIIGLALQPTLGNFFAGTAIEIERPVRVGDYIRQGEITGRVEALHWRSAFIRSGDQSLIVLPNSQFGGSSLEVFPQGRPIGCSTPFTVPGDVPPGIVMRLANQVLRSGIPGICTAPEPSAALLGVDGASGNLRYCARFFSADFAQRGDITSAVIERLWYGLSRAGFAMAKPNAVLAGVDSAGSIAFAPPQPPDIALPPPDHEWIAHYLPGLGSAAAKAFAEAGTRLRYAEDETLRPGEPADSVAIILAGRLRLERPEDEGDWEADVARIVGAEPLPAPAHPPNPHILQPFIVEAAKSIGPLAYTLADLYASRTDDAFLVCRALAQAIDDPTARDAVIAAGPALPSHVLEAGAVFGWGALLGPPEPAGRHWAATESEVLYVPLHRLAPVFAQAADLKTLCATLREKDPACRHLTPELLRQFR